MVENITSYLDTGVSLLETFRHTLEGTFLGAWIWVIVLMVVDLTVFYKTRNMLMTAFVNAVISYVYMQYLPSQINLFLVVFIAISFALAILQMYYSKD